MVSELGEVFRKLKERDTNINLDRLKKFLYNCHDLDEQQDAAHFFNLIMSHKDLEVITIKYLSNILNQRERISKDYFYGILN